MNCSPSIQFNRTLPRRYDSSLVNDFHRLESSTTPQHAEFTIQSESIVVCATDKIFTKSSMEHIRPIDLLGTVMDYLRFTPLIHSANRPSA